MSRRTKELRAAARARKRQQSGDPRPYMVILREERSHLGIFVSLPASRVVDIRLPEGIL